MSAVVTGLDHVMLAVVNLDDAAALVSTSLGLHVSGGGIHPSRGTMNRIIVIGSSYIELIAACPGTTPSGFISAMLLAGGSGWVGFALSTEDPLRAAAYLTAQGYTVEGPSEGRLDTGDRFSRSWHTVRIAEGSPGAPFLIRHQTVGEDRRRLLAGTVGLHDHDLGVRSIGRLLIACTDDTNEAFYRHYLDLPAASHAFDSMLDARTSTFSLGDGTELTLAVPRDGALGPVAERLRIAGPGLMAVTLAVNDLAAAVRDLRGRGIGVRVDEPDGVLIAAQLQYKQTLGARFALIQAR